MAAVECKLSKILMSETSDHQVIYLKEKDGPRFFPIMIGIFEVYAIHRIINKEPPPRPLTHELIGSILGSLSIEVERVIVNDLVDGTFYARLMLRHGGEVYDVDSRPSDAITLAVQSGAPIFVEEQVLDEVARTE
jgi:bifunctional DNase/RNase